MGGGGKPYSPYFFRFIQYKNPLRTVVVPLELFCRRRFSP